MNTEHFNPYNPFTLIREEEDVPVFVNELVKNFKNSKTTSQSTQLIEWRDSLIKAIVYFLYKECAPWEQNFVYFSKLLNSVSFVEILENYQSPLDIIFEDLEKIAPTHIAVTQYSIFKQAPAREAATIVAEIMKEMIILGYGTWARTTKDKENSVETE